MKEKINIKEIKIVDKVAIGIGCVGVLFGWLLNPSTIFGTIFGLVGIISFGFILYLHWRLRTLEEI